MTEFATPNCMVCGRSERLSLDDDRYRRWMAGEFTQDVWPHWSDHMREMLITGTHPSCWDKLFPDPEDAA